MINENLEKLVQLARDKKPTDFKEILTSELDNRIDARVSEIRGDLSKNMFSSKPEITENCEGHPDGVEHTHDDGTVHTHEGGDKPHTHDEEVEEGTLPPALQKAIDAKKKNNSKSDDVDKSPEDDEDEDKKKDENIANFGDKKAKPFKDDDDKDKKDKKEDIRIASQRILNKSK